MYLIHFKKVELEIGILCDQASMEDIYIFPVNFRPDTTQFYDPLLRVNDVVTGRERFFSRATSRVTVAKLCIFFFLLRRKGGRRRKRIIASIRYSRRVARYFSATNFLEIRSADPRKLSSPPSH